MNNNNEKGRYYVEQIRDDIDQAPVAHGGVRGDLVDGAARLEVGGRGRGRPGGLAGELRLQYHLNHKNEHNISERGYIM